MSTFECWHCGGEYYGEPGMVEPKGTGFAEWCRGCLPGGLTPNKRVERPAPPKEEE